nr:holo-ACP synthase [Treponema phagedenis]
MQKWRNNKKLLERFFHSEEVRLFYDCGKKNEFLASRFAAKEAFGKALGTGLKNIRLKEIQVTKNINGKPILKISGNAENVFRNLKGKYLHLSLSHEKNNAVAIVIIEGEKND